MIRLPLISMTIVLAVCGLAAAENAPAGAPEPNAAMLAPPAPVAAPAEKPVTAPDSYRVVMENERVRMIEVHIKPRSKVTVGEATGRERFLYMLTDGALVLAAPGKAPYEFAMHAGETAVFPAISPTVENDTDAPVRALLVEMKGSARAATLSDRKGRHAVKTRGKGKVVARATATRSGMRPRAGARSKPAAAKSVKPVARGKSAATKPTLKPLNLRKAASQPLRRNAI
jgi:hypothetical protein